MDEEPRMRIAIYGAGGLGGYYGARLACAGNPVAFIARGAHLDAIREHGLQVYSPLGDVHLPKPVATADPADAGPADLVLVAVKTWQIPAVAAAMAPLLGDDTVVLPLLNGVEASDALAAVVGSGRVLGGLSKVFSKIESPGVIRQFTRVPSSRSASWTEATPNGYGRSEKCSRPPASTPRCRARSASSSGRSCCS